MQILLVCWSRVVDKPTKAFLIHLENCLSLSNEVDLVLDCYLRVKC